MPAFIDSKFPRDDTATMQRAVAGAQERRRTIMGPPQPEAPVDMSEGVEAKGRRLLTERLSQGPPSPEMQNMVVNGGRPYAPRTPTMPAEVGGQPAEILPPTRPQAAYAPRLNPLALGAPAGAASGLSVPIAPANSLSRGARPGAGSSLGGPVRVGRSANDPLRIAEQARRRGNIGPMMDLAKTQMQEDRADVRTERGEQRADARYDQQRRDRMDEWTQSQAAEAAREQRQNERQDQGFDKDTQRRANESSVEWERRRLIMAEEKAAQGDPNQVRTVPIPGTDYVVPYTGNRAMGTLPVAKPAPPLPAGMVPRSAQRDGVSYEPGNPTPEVKLPKIYQGKPDALGKPTRDYYYEPDPKTGKPRKIYIEDKDGDGVPDNQQKGAAAPAAPAQTASGIKFKLKA